jgi:hypothetical protein
MAFLRTIPFSFFLLRIPEPRILKIARFPSLRLSISHDLLAALASCYPGLLGGFCALQSIIDRLLYTSMTLQDRCWSWTNCQQPQS